MCSYGTELETNESFLLYCYCFSSQRSKLFDNFYNLDLSLSKLNNKEKVAYLFHGLANNPNTLIKVAINLVIKFLKSTGGFDRLLILTNEVFFLF